MRKVSSNLLQLLLLIVLPALSQTVVTPVAAVAENVRGARQTLQYGVEWRLVRAGTARLAWAPAADSAAQADLYLESAGMVSKLYRVNDHYKALMDANLCAQRVNVHAEEGKRRRDTTITFNQGKVSYLERDLVKNNVALAKEIETPSCVHEYMGGLMKLRTLRLEPGQSVQIPLTDGKKFANVKVDAEEREQIRIGSQAYNTIRYEVHMLNDVLIRRKAKMEVWISDDARRLPVQVRVRMSVLIGTITLQLEKME